MKKEIVRFLKAFFCKEFFGVLAIMIILAFIGTMRNVGELNRTKWEARGVQIEQNS
jgi:hypothetical protein